MAGLVRRLTLSLKGGLAAFLAPAEDPRRTFANAYQRQHELLARVQQALAEIAGAKSRLKTKTQEVRAKLPQLEQQARLALGRDREDLARIVLQRRQVAVIELQTLEDQVREVEQEEQRLSLVEQRLATQVEAFVARQEVIAARYTTAEAQVRINEALTGVSAELVDLDLALEQTEQKAERMQARAAAIDQLVEAGVLEMPGVTGGDPLERQFAQLDIAQAVEDQLALLKRQLAQP